jgi:hypothetical protein
MGSTAAKAGMNQSKVSQEKIDKVHSMVKPEPIKRQIGGGAFGKSKSRKKARGAQGMLDRQLATLDNMKSKMRQPGDVSGVQGQANKASFALRGMKGSALAKIVEDNKAKAKKHLK